MDNAGQKPVPMDGLVVLVRDVYTFMVDRFWQSYGEFRGVPMDSVLTWGTYSVSLLNMGNWGRFYQQAVALLTAHQLAKVYQVDYDSGNMRDQGTSGIVTSKSANTSGMSESNSVSALLTGDDAFTADLAQTQYGLQLLALIEVLMPIASLVSGEPLRGNVYSQYGWPKRIDS